VNKEYKVFISSTSDLAQERAEAIRAVLACNCIPVSMENWAASSADPVSRITEKLAACDYFVLLAGYRSGTTLKELGMPYVELEYEYASKRDLRKVILLKDLKPGEEPDPRQLEFRTRLSDNHAIQTWRDPHDIARLVMGSLFEMIVFRESAGVVKTNAELADEVGRYLEGPARFEGTARAYVLQYTAVNALEVLRKLLWADVETDLYVVSEDRVRALSEYQEDRLKKNLLHMPNHLEPIGQKLDLDRLLHVYAYNTPGSLRAVLIDTVLPTGKVRHEFVAVSSYVYMMKEPEGKLILDIRGGELPSIVLRPRHDGFDLFSRLVAMVLRNWQEFRDMGTIQPVAFSGGKA
jgi:hypothetical protein